MNIKFTDNSDQVKAEIQAAALRALEKCGLTGEGYAKKACPVDTGNLRNSISHAVDPGEMTAYVGTNSEYGVYVEMGTGVYAEGGGGRPTPWVYQDAKGNWHYTEGNRALPFIKPTANGFPSEDPPKVMPLTEYPAKGGDWGNSDKVGSGGSGVSILDIDTDRDILISRIFKSNSNSVAGVGVDIKDQLFGIVKIGVNAGIFPMGIYWEQYEWQGVCGIDG